MFILKKIGKFFDFFEELLIVLGLAFMTIMNFANVISRYLLTNSFSFTEELTIMAFVWITMLGIATGYKQVAHLGMSYVVEKFDGKGQARFAIFSMICSLIMIIILVYEGFIMVQNQVALNSRTPALQLPSAMQGLAIPVGGILIAIRTFQSGLSEYRRLKDLDTTKEGV